MRKNYFFILLIFFMRLISFSQPILTSASFQDFFVEEYNVPNVMGITIGGSGSNQIWDYSSVVVENINTSFISNFQPNLAPYYNSFPNANYCMRFFSSTSDVLTSGGFFFYNITEASYELLGNSSAPPSPVFGVWIDTPLTPLPFNFNDQFIDVFQAFGDPNPSTSTNSYDAYGTLITPFGTNTNVVRLKTVYTNSTFYSWIKINPYTPLLTIEVFNANSNVISAKVYQNNGLGINQNGSNKKVIAYPNPASNILNLQMPSNTSIDKIIITDLVGKIVIEETLNKSFINIENLSSGLYILQAYSNGQKMETKFNKQ